MSNHPTKHLASKKWVLCGVLVASWLQACTTETPAQNNGASEGPAAASVPTIAVTGELVPGALVTIVGSGLGQQRGREASVRMFDLQDTQPLDDQGSLILASGQQIDGNGSVQFEVYMPSGALGDEGPAVVAPKQYGLEIQVDEMAAIAMIEISMANAKEGYPYEVSLVSECGPARVVFDGSIWTPRSEPSPSQLESDGLTHGVMTVGDSGTGKLLFKNGTSIDLVSAKIGSPDTPVAGR